VLHFPPPSFTQPAVSRLSHRENTGTFVQKLHCDTREKFVVTMNLLMHVLHERPALRAIIRLIEDETYQPKVIFNSGCRLEFSRILSKRKWHP
jgi:hypothetical protein